MLLTGKTEIKSFLCFRFSPQSFTFKVPHVGLQLRWHITALWAIHPSPCQLLSLVNFLVFVFPLAKIQLSLQIQCSLLLTVNLQGESTWGPREACRFAEGNTDVLLISVNTLLRVSRDFSLNGRSKNFPSVQWTQCLKYQPEETWTQIQQIFGSYLPLDFNQP